MNGLGYDSGFYFGKTWPLTEDNLIASAKSISGSEEGRNVVTIEATLKQLSDRNVKGKYTTTARTVVITNLPENEADIAILREALSSNEDFYFAVTKPGTKTGKGGPVLVTKVSESEITNEGLMETTVELTPVSAELIEEVTIGEAVETTETTEE